MKLIQKFFLPTLVFLTLTSCFEVREEVNLKADGTGEVTVVANLSESKGKLHQYMKMEKVEGYRVPKPAEVDAALVQLKALLNATKGVTFVHVKSDWSNFIFSVNARFDNLEALNAAVRTISQNFKQYGIPPIEQDNFKLRDKQFQRLFNYSTQRAEFEALPSMQRFMLESARMIAIYRFEQPIKGFSNKKAAVSPSGKAIMLQVPLAELAKGTSTLANEVKF